MTTDPGKGTEELSTAQSWAAVREAPVGRLAVVVDGAPDIFPVNHQVDHGSVVFRTAAGTKLAAAVGHEVAFEVDGYDPSTRTAWSVVVKGEAQRISRLYDVLDAVELPIFPWHGGAKPYFVRIEPDLVTGRRFTVSANSETPEDVDVTQPTPTEG